MKLKKLIAPFFLLIMWVMVSSQMPPQHWDISDWERVQTEVTITLEGDLTECEIWKEIKEHAELKIDSCERKRKNQ